MYYFANLLNSNLGADMVQNEEKRARLADAKGHLGLRVPLLPSSRSLLLSSKHHLLQLPLRKTRGWWRLSLMRTLRRGPSSKRVGLWWWRPPTLPLWAALHLSETTRQALPRPLASLRLKVAVRTPLQPHLPLNCPLSSNMLSKPSKHGWQRTRTRPLRGKGWASTLVLSLLNPTPS